MLLVRTGRLVGVGEHDRIHARAAVAALLRLRSFASRTVRGTTPAMTAAKTTLPGRAPAGPNSATPATDTGRDPTGDADGVRPPISSHRPS
jgi:hypothetical protein